MRLSIRLFNWEGMGPISWLLLRCISVRCSRPLKLGGGGSGELVMAEVQNPEFGQAA